MVPLEKVLRKPPLKREPEFVPPRPRPRPAAAPAPRQPRRFKVVEVITGRVLAEDVEAGAAVGALAQVQRLADAHVYVWQPTSKRWRLLTIAEQKLMWERRLPDA
jgi:hypothetical protein